MGQRGRERVLAEFSLDKSVATYESVYRELSDVGAKCAGFRELATRPLRPVGGYL